MNSGILLRLRGKVRDVNIELIALWFAYRDQRTPWYAKLFGALVAGYAFSPIDLIPDFIPILGYFDDAVIIPIGIAVAKKLIPKDVMADCRLKARMWFNERKEKPKSRVFALVIVFIWTVIIAMILYAILRIFILQ